MQKLLRIIRESVNTNEVEPREKTLKVTAKLKEILTIFFQNEELITDTKI